jgi:hypothetical protein
MWTITLLAPIQALWGDRQIQSLAWRSQSTNISPSDLQQFFVGGVRPQ